MYAPMALGAIGSTIGCAIPGQTACGAMLDVESGYGRFVGVSAMPSSQTIYGIVVMFTLQAAATDGDVLILNAQNAGGIFGIGVFAGLALLLSGIYQGRCCAASINASKNKPEIFGLSIAPAGIVEGFAGLRVCLRLGIERRTAGGSSHGIRFHASRAVHPFHAAWLGIFDSLRQTDTELIRRPRCPKHQPQRVCRS